MTADIPYYTLNNGSKMPSIGKGCVYLLDATSMMCVDSLIDAGSVWTEVITSQNRCARMLCRYVLSCTAHMCANISTYTNELVWLSSLGYCKHFHHVTDGTWFMKEFVNQAAGYGKYPLQLWSNRIFFKNTTIGNEALVGEAIRDSGISRSNIFLTTKLPWVTWW